MLGSFADVWACGVLLFVMLLGAFPFEHSQGEAKDDNELFKEVYFEQIRIHWTENPNNQALVKHMSPECVDLLDRIFTIKEKDRITISEIRQHPWFTAPLSPKYAKALQDLNEQQDLLHALFEKYKVRTTITKHSLFTTLRIPQ